VPDSIFTAEGDGFLATGHGSGPWDPRALHGGAPAALITRAFERFSPGAELPLARIGFELLRPVPFGPLTISTTMVREGRRVQELTAELHAGEQVICRASGLRVAAVPGDLPPLPETHPDPPMPGPQDGEPVRFALDDSSRDSFAATAMEMRWIDDHRSPGPGRVWMRLRHPLLPGEPLTPLQRLAATADFGNGVSASLPFDRFLFINADLTIHLHRHPRGEWIGLDAQTLLSPGGTGLAEGILHDLEGPVGRSFQSLVVGPR